MAILRPRERLRVARTHRYVDQERKDTGMTEGRLAGRRILLGVAGSIAAYKAVLLSRLLVKELASLQVVMTASASQFVGASTFGGVTGKPVLTDMFDPGAGGERHIALATELD